MLRLWLLVLKIGAGIKTTSCPLKGCLVCPCQLQWYNQDFHDCHRFQWIHHDFHYHAYIIIIIIKLICCKPDLTSVASQIIIFVNMISYDLIWSFLYKSKLPQSWLPLQSNFKENNPLLYSKWNLVVETLKLFKLRHCGAIFDSWNIICWKWIPWTISLGFEYFSGAADIIKRSPVGRSGVGQSVSQSGVERNRKQETG